MFSVVSASLSVQELGRHVTTANLFTSGGPPPDSANSVKAFRENSIRSTIISLVVYATRIHIGQKCFSLYSVILFIS